MKTLAIAASTIMLVRLPPNWDESRDRDQVTRNCILARFPLSELRSWHRAEVAAGLDEVGSWMAS
jgi:hypothetical protein